METRARFTLVGLFALAVLVAGFMFVYWLNTGGFGARSYYRVRFEGSVAGLLKGSAVLFNGMRVGEVTGLKLDAGSPRHVFVDLAVDASAPVQPDTRAAIEFQGLAGAPVVALAGGTPGASMPPPTREQPWQLAGDKDSGRTMTETAREVLRHVDTVLSDNEKPLKNTIASIEKFSDALARNSDRVDGIVAGLERLTGGGAKAPPRFFDLPPARTFTGLQRLPSGIVQILEPTALSLLDSEKIVVRGAADKPALDNAQWPDMLPKVVQARLVQSFENAGFMGAIGRAPEGVIPDTVVQITIESFAIEAQPSPNAELKMSARIVGKDGKITTARVFGKSVPAQSLESPIAAKALAAAFEALAAEIVGWICANA